MLASTDGYQCSWCALPFQAVTFKRDQCQLHVEDLLYYFTIPYFPPKFTSKLQLLETLLNGFNHSKPLLQSGLRGMLNSFRTAIKCIKRREKIVVFILQLSKNFLLLSRA